MSHAIKAETNVGNLLGGLQLDARKAHRRIRIDSAEWRFMVAYITGQF